MPTMLPLPTSERSRSRSIHRRIDSPAKNIEKCPPPPSRRGLPPSLLRVIKCRDSCDVSRAREGGRIDPRSAAGGALKRPPYARTLAKGVSTRCPRRGRLSARRCTSASETAFRSIISRNTGATLRDSSSGAVKRYAEMRERSGSP